MFAIVWNVATSGIAVLYLSKLIKPLDDEDVRRWGSCSRYQAIMNRVAVIGLIFLVIRGIWG